MKKQPDARKHRQAHHQCRLRSLGFGCMRIRPPNVNFSGCAELRNFHVPGSLTPPPHPTSPPVGAGRPPRCEESGAAGAARAGSGRRDGGWGRSASTALGPARAERLQLGRAAQARVVAARQAAYESGAMPSRGREVVRAKNRERLDRFA
jgi:hypothetical protein